MPSAPTPITRAALASFLEKAVRSGFDTREWEQVIVNHFRDDEMESARRECVRLLGIKAEGDWTKLSQEDGDHLRSLAAALRRP